VRIVSLLPSATEIVYALGLGDQLEGRTFECDYPPEAQQKPIVSSSGLPENLLLGEIDDAVRAATAGETPLYRLDEARIAQIQPDLILTQDLCRVCAVPSGDVDEALGRLGCRAEVVSLDPYSLDEVMIDIENVGRAAGVDARADLLVDSLRARMAAVEANVLLTSVGRFGADADPRRVLVLEWATRRGVRGTGYLTWSRGPGAGLCSGTRAATPTGPRGMPSARKRRRSSSSRRAATT
jgi:iron complex transport system substrate-binding protein